MKAIYGNTKAVGRRSLRSAGVILLVTLICLFGVAGTANARIWFLSIDIPYNAIDFGPVTPAELTPQTITRSYPNCNVRGLIWPETTIEILVAPDTAEDAYFSSPTEGQGFPISQLEAWDNSSRELGGQIWNPLAVGTPCRLERVSVFIGFDISFVPQFRLCLNGDEPAGSYSATIEFTVVAR